MVRFWCGKMLGLPLPVASYGCRIAGELQGSAHNASHTLSISIWAGTCSCAQFVTATQGH